MSSIPSAGRLLCGCTVSMMIAGLVARAPMGSKVAHVLRNGTPAEPEEAEGPRGVPRYKGCRDSAARHPRGLAEYGYAQPRLAEGRTHSRMTGMPKTSQSIRT